MSLQALKRDMRCRVMGSAAILVLGLSPMMAGCAVVEHQDTDVQPAGNNSSKVTTTTQYYVGPFPITDPTTNMNYIHPIGGGHGQPGQSSSSSASSDIRLKRDLVRVARLDNGLNLYRFRYIWSDQVYVGVMAQEVARVAPSAVTVGDDGFLKVDYRQLGLRLETWEEWSRAHSELKMTAN